MRKQLLLTITSLLTVGVAITNANVLAYEGIASPGITDGSPLASLPSTGTGWNGNWTPTSKNTGTSSYFWDNGGFSYPAGTGGTLTPTAGGVAVVQGDADADSDADFDGTVGGAGFFRLNFDSATASAVNSGGPIFVSWLGARLGPEASSTYLSSNTNPFPRNAGLRLPNNSGSTDNNSMGFIGTNGSNSPGWGAWGFKDQNGLIDNGGTVAAGAVNFFVMALDPATSQMSVWVNPTESGNVDAYMSWTYLDGDTVMPISLYGIGLEANQADYMPPPTGSGGWVPNPDGRPAGHFAIDEIRVGTTIESVAGFTPVPEPSTYALVFGVLALALLLVRRFRKD